MYVFEINFKTPVENGFTAINNIGVPQGFNLSHILNMNYLSYENTFTGDFE